MVKITALEIDGFGVWSGLKIEGLSDGLNVLYGPNEAGKTTLLQFVRSVLYGFSPARQRYLPPVRGGRPGGTVELAGPNGRFRLDRHRDADGEAGPCERLDLTAPDGTRQGEHMVKVLLADVDEAIYNNVFAVGLRELQELGTLSDTEAAELLYSLTAGLDRVSLVEVMRELQTSRNRVLSADGEACQVVELLARREQLRLEIEELGKLTHRYVRLAAARDRLQRESTRLEEENNQTEHLARVIELAISLGGRWQQRAALDDQLSALGPLGTVPEKIVDRLDALNARLAKHRQRAAEIHDQRKQLRAEAAGLGINEGLWRQAARVEALGEQQSWIGNLENQTGELEREIAGLKSQLSEEQQRLGIGDRTEPGSLPTVSARALAQLRGPAKALKRSRVRLDETKQEAAAANETAAALSREIETALAARKQTDLNEAVDRAGNLVSQFRRRLQIDERLDQMTRYQSELEEQSRNLVDRQLLPVWVLAGFGAVFVLGVVLVMAGLFMPASITGAMGWALALLGLAGAGAAGAGKVLLERSNVRQLEVCQKQISMLRSQIRQATDERSALDGQLPRGGGPLVSRLEAAETELAALEELVPLETRRTTALQEADAAGRRQAIVEQELAEARHRWQEALVAAGLPGRLAPKQVRQLVGRCDQIAELQRRLEHRCEELAQRRRELDSLHGRIAQLAADTGVAAPGARPLEQLVGLVEALDQQEEALGRRRQLRLRARQLRRQRAKHEAAVSRFRHRRRQLLLESGAGNEQELRQRAVEAARAGVLRKEREALDREIAAAIAGHCPVEEVCRQIEANSTEQLQTRRDELLDRLGSLEGELRERLERRGQLAEQLKVLADDRQMASKQLELATVEKQLEDAVRRWQVLAVTGRVLDEIRTTYEQQRQPETLQEASGYLDRLTGGRYRRVWTPLGEDVLRVDDAEGDALAVEQLSRGTREQLFLSLRLALAAAYARRGAPLPIVLDDVLVNFDSARAKAAAAVLRDFAAAGHQLLVFTCHEHILKLFKSLKVSVSQLPENTASEPPPVIFQQPARQRPKKAKKPQPQQQPEAEPPAEEILPAEAQRPGQEIVEVGGEESPAAEIFDSAEEDVPWDEEEDNKVFDADYYDDSDVQQEEEDEQEELEEEDEDEDEEEDEYEDEDEEEDEDEDGYEEDGTSQAA